MLLLVVDMQKGLFDTAPRHDAQGVICRINRLIALFRKRQDQVIFIQHDGPKGDALEPQTPGWEILDDLDRQPEDPVVRKKSCDAFLNTRLMELIDSLGQDQVLVTGCATDFCVDTTIRSAAGRGLGVMVARDAHTTADRPHLTAEAIITHHNWSWENLILEHGQIRVENTEAIIQELS